MQKQKHFSNKQKLYSKEIYKLKAKENHTSCQPLVSRDKQRSASQDLVLLFHYAIIDTAYLQFDQNYKYLTCLKLICMLCNCDCKYKDLKENDLHRTEKYIEAYSGQ